jgi:hypothetical protein
LLQFQIHNPSKNLLFALVVKNCGFYNSTHKHTHLKIKPSLLHLFVLASISNSQTNQKPIVYFGFEKFWGFDNSPSQIDDQHTFAF